MDPDALLRDLLALADETIAHADTGIAGDAAHERALELAEKVYNLNDWIKRGGFLPAVWAARTVVTPTAAGDQAALDTGIGFPSAMPRVETATRNGVTVEMRPPKLGERGWWVKAFATAESALDEVLADPDGGFWDVASAEDARVLALDKRGDGLRAVTVRDAPIDTATIIREPVLTPREWLIIGAEMRKAAKAARATGYGIADEYDAIADKAEAYRP